MRATETRNIDFLGHFVFTDLIRWERQKQQAGVHVFFLSSCRVHMSSMLVCVFRCRSEGSRRYTGCGASRSSTSTRRSVAATSCPPRTHGKFAVRKSTRCWGEGVFRKFTRLAVILRIIDPLPFLRCRDRAHCSFGLGGLLICCLPFVV